MIQRYLMGDHPNWLDAIAASTLAFDTAAGIDYVIGEPDLVGQGPLAMAMTSSGSRRPCPRRMPDMRVIDGVRPPSAGAFALVTGLHRR